eukprot:scaffold193725_cov22-Prasinocladus_malaysianus.AAC.1
MESHSIPKADQKLRRHERMLPHGHSMSSTVVTRVVQWRSCTVWQAAARTSDSVVMMSWPDDIALRHLNCMGLASRPT